MMKSVISLLGISLLGVALLGTQIATAQDKQAQQVQDKPQAQQVQDKPQAQNPALGRPFDQAEGKKADDAEILARIEKSLNAIRSMKAEFIQRAPDGSVSEGMLYLERPGKIRFDFGEDAPFLVVSNGTLLTFVDYEVKQVSRWPIRKTPLGILVDEEIKFDSSIEIPEIIRFAGLIKLPVIDPKRREYGYIILIFEESTMELRAWEIVDAQGYTTRVALVNPEYNVKIDKKYFTFKDPRKSKRGPRRR